MRCPHCNTETGNDQRHCLSCRQYIPQTSPAGMQPSHQPSSTPLSNQTDPQRAAQKVPNAPNPPQQHGAQVAATAPPSWKSITKNTGLKVSLAITLFLLLIAVGGAAFLSYNVYYLNNAHLRLQGKLAGAFQTTAEQKREIDKGNQMIADYSEVNAVLENSASQMEATYIGMVDERNNRIANYIGVNAELENSTRQLEATNESLTQKNQTLTGEKNSLNSQVSSLQSQLTRAKAQQVAIPNCASNYYTTIGGKLSCIARNSNAFRATQTETSTVQLPHSGIVNLKINRSGELGSDRSMEILKHAVKTIEGYMGEPIPLKGNEIRLDFAKEELFQCGSGAAACHRGNHVEIREEFDSEKPQWGEDTLGMIIAHEVAHYYFSRGRNWLDEGAADFLAVYIENKRVGGTIRSRGKDCTQASTIRDLESRKYKLDDDGFSCNYTLGAGLFLALHDQIEQEDFRKAFRKLHTISEDKRAGIYQVRQAFYSGSERVQRIIDKWYGYREKPEAHWPDGSFLAYYTWQKGGEWWFQSQGNKPCAQRLSYDESSNEYIGDRYNSCQLTGDWDKNKDLIVTVRGESYRAVEVQIAKNPDDYSHNVRVPDQHYGRLMVR